MRSMSVERREPNGALGGLRDDAAIAGIVARLSGGYVLRGFGLVAGAFGDIRAGLLGQAINTANIAPVIHTDAGRRAAEADGVLPDDARRPISVGRLADSAGLPFETARRVVQRLTDTGACVRVEGGLIVPKAFVMRPSTFEAVAAAAGYTRRFLRDLEAVGLVEAAPASTWPADETMSARRRGVLSTEYGLRALRLLVDTYGSIQSGIVAQTIMTANTAHLDAPTGEGWRYAAIDAAPPDEVRRPVSVSRLADALALPFETMRRQVQQLIEAGACVRTDGGVVIPAAASERPEAVRATLLNASYVRRFVRDLHAAGFAIRAGAASPTAASPTIGRGNRA